MTALKIVQGVVLAVFVAWISFGSWHSWQSQAVGTLVKDMAQFITPVITLIGILIAAFVAYQTWLSPFQPTVQARPFIWRLGPGNPPSCPFTVVIYSTFFNIGSISGAVSDLLLEIELPKGNWVMEPLFFVKAGEFYQDALKPEVKVSFPIDSVEGPFTPIFLPGRTQVTKAVLFCRGLGKDDFNIDFIEPGQHPLRVFARYNRAAELTKVVDAKIIFESDVIAGWRAGRTLVGEVRHRDTQIKALPRK